MAITSRELIECLKGLTAEERQEVIGVFVSIGEPVSCSAPLTEEQMAWYGLPSLTESGRGLGLGEVTSRPSPADSEAHGVVSVARGQ